MSELYTKPDVAKAFEAGRKAANYAIDDAYGPLDIHTADAALECLQQINVLTREHEDHVFSQRSVMAAEAAEPKAVAQEILALCDAHESAPTAVATTEAGLSPEMVLALVQLANMIWKLFGR